MVADRYSDILRPSGPKTTLDMLRRGSKSSIDLLEAGSRNKYNDEARAVAWGIISRFH